MTKKLILLLFVTFSQLIHSTISFTQVTEQNFDPSQVHVTYSNVSVIGRTEYPMSVSLTVTGLYKQTGWLVLTSPWKPLLIVSNNTDQPFIELTYDPQQMTTNPISNTSFAFAWDYDPISEVIFVKLLITFTVTISIQFGVLNIIKFEPSKQIYATSETVEVTMNVYGNYTAQLSMNWIAKIIAKDMVGNTVKTVEQEFQLSQTETKQLTFSLGPFDEGIYTASAQIIDPRTQYTLTTEQLTFETKKLQPQPLVPPWAPWIFLALAIIAVVIMNNLYSRRKRHPLKKFKSHNS